MSESPIPTSAMLTNWGSSQNQNPSSNKRAFLELEQDELDFLLSPKRFRHELSPVPNGTYSMFWSEPGSMESEDDDDVDDGHIDEEEIAVLFSPSIMTFDWSFDDISEHLSMQGPAGRKTTISESSDPGYNTDDGQEVSVDIIVYFKERKTVLVQSLDYILFTSILQVTVLCQQNLN